jgi:ATP-dependent DNA helicase DinG
MDVKQIKNILDDYLNKIRNAFPGYEERPEQYDMIRTILNGIYQKKHVLVEAGTGTGKSLAYILAALALMEASENKKKTIISTYTINLQEQLINKDFPVLNQILGLESNIALAKGRANYLCENRINNILVSLEGVFTSAEDALNFRDLLNEVLDGKDLIKNDKSEIETKIFSSVWTEVCSTNETCLDESCPYISSCGFKQARRELEDADFIISNHALFLTDLMLRGNAEEAEGGILPKYDYVIFDEAHHLESAATSTFSVVLNKSNLIQPAAWLRSILKRVMVRDAFSQAGYELSSITNLIQSYFSANDNFFKQFELKVEEDDIYKFSESDEFMNQVKQPLYDLDTAVEAAMDTINIDPICKVELKKIKQNITNLIESIEFVLDANDPAYTYWIEKSFEVNVYAAPLEIDEMMRSAIYSKEVPTVLTSATLAVPDMTFFANRLGIDNYRASIISSPFEYSKQAKLIVPTYAIEPNYKKETEYEKVLVRMIKEAFKEISGGMFVLFTSYKMLNSVYDEIIGEIDTEIYKQGDMSRNILLKEFASHGNAILLGTSSFWEGVDVVGDNLRCVLLAKLPFPVPNDPLVEARMQKISERGGNGFRDYMLPQAVLQFKQGFGRLIRTKSDTGIVIVADKRIISKSYGKMFVRSLPEILIESNIIDIKRSS